MKKGLCKTILVTGGAGFIGSHICVELLSGSFEVIVVDNFCNSNERVIERIEKITGKSIVFYNTDIRDREGLEAIFSKHEVEAVIHCAGLKSVGESAKEPLLYYDNNIYGSLVLVQVMAEYAVKTIVFSSSATVYGKNAEVPYHEGLSLKPVNPYGNTKLFVEEMLRDLVSSDPEWRVALLRYFNPVGAHPSGLIGEQPSGVPNNLMPYVCEVASSRQPELLIFGGDYETPDGTGVRDYIHVVDLAKGHLSAISWLQAHAGVLVANLGTGKGVSVLGLVQAFAEASGRTIPHRIVSRREGDVPVCYADSSYAEKELGWRAERTIEEACRDSWRWQQHL